MKNLQKYTLDKYSHKHFFHKKAVREFGILGKEREPEVGKLGWHGNFDTGFGRNIISFKIPCAGFLNFFEIATVLLV